MTRLRAAGAWTAWATCMTLAACGDGGSPEPELPTTIGFGDVDIDTAPLRLRMPGRDFSVDSFVEVGVVDAVDPTRYYDPRGTDADVTWKVATSAVAFDEAADRLTLDNGVTLALARSGSGGGVGLTLDASAVPGAVLLRLVAPCSQFDKIYGFGENFASAVANGSVREMQFRVDFDSESSTNETHVPVPLALWPGIGVGLFVDDPRPGAFDVCVARPDRVLATFTLADPGPLTAHLFTADEPLDLLRRYAALTALPALPPLWAFAPQQWRNEHASSQEVRDDADAMRSLDIPGSVMWIDNPWETGYNDFIVDEQRFAEPAALLDDLAAQGYRVVFWSTPYVNKEGPTAADFLEARDAGYLVTGDFGRAFDFPWASGPGGLVDFTADGATNWWRERIARVTTLGAAGFKLDYGEDLVPELVGSLTPFQTAAGGAQRMHNAFAAAYHQAYLGALPAGDGFLITRAGSYGEQAVNTCIWPGDLDSDLSLHGVDNGDGLLNVGGLPAAIAGGLSLSVSGYPFYGSDIGGFREGTPSTETLLRWAEYASLGTIMQLGGDGPSHNPWDETLFDPEAVPIYRRYARLHMDLVPYLYSLAVVAAADGTPVTRPTGFAYLYTASDDATFMVGDQIFVAPVIEAGAVRRGVTMPPGRWIDWWTGEATDSDGLVHITVDAPLDTLPLWRRSGALVPLYAREADTLLPATAPGVRSYADRAYGRELRLWATPDTGPAAVALWDGTTASATVVANHYLLTATPGDTFDIITFDLDARATLVAATAAPAAVLADAQPLPAAADEAALAACPAPGCWLWEPAARRLRIRAHLQEMTQITVE